MTKSFTVRSVKQRANLRYLLESMTSYEKNDSILWTTFRQPFSR